jgi:hypothetical protein
MRRLSPVRCLLLVLAVGLLAGCGGGAAGDKGHVTVYKAGGKITFVGGPVIGAAVTFAPQENQPAAVGRTNEAGEFVLSTYGGGDGAAAGEYKVLVTLVDAAEEPAEEAHSADPGFVIPDAHSGAGKKVGSGSLLPVNFSDINQTPLTAKVEPGGTNNFTFELK